MKGEQAWGRHAAVHSQARARERNAGATEAHAKLAEGASHRMCQDPLTRPNQESGYPTCTRERNRAVDKAGVIDAGTSSYPRMHENPEVV